MKERKPPSAGSIVHIGDQTIVAFRYPYMSPGQPFEPTENERQLSEFCIAILGKGPGYVWPPETDGADWVAKKFGGTVEKVTAKPVVLAVVGETRSPEVLVRIELSPVAIQGSLFGGG
jgi:hypothetical protein